jgi:hypothetical protein
MVIREAQDVTGLNFRQLDEALGYEDGYCRRYSLFPKPCRAPQAGRLQDLENRVAKLLLRPPHVVILENLTEVLGAPHSGMNARNNSRHSLWFTYADGWPTYDLISDHVEPDAPNGRRFDVLESRQKVYELLRDAAPSEKWPPLLRAYAWQWGCLWDRGLLWLSRKAFGMPDDADISSLIAREALRLTPSLAHGGKTSLKSSFYCGLGEPYELELGPPDAYFSELDGPDDGPMKWLGA